MRRTRCYTVFAALQLYIGADPKARDLFCVRYASSAFDMTIIIVASVVSVSCLVVFVAAVVVCVRHRRLRSRTASAAAAAGNVRVVGGIRYAEVTASQRSGDAGLGGGGSKIGGNVRFGFSPMRYDADGDEDDELR